MTPPISAKSHGLATALTDLAMQAQQLEDGCQSLNHKLKEANDALIQEKAAKNELEARAIETQQLQARYVGLEKHSAHVQRRLEESLLRASQAEAERIKSSDLLTPLISKAEQLERECESLQHRLDKADTASRSLRTEKDSVSEVLVSVRKDAREAKAARAANVAELKQEIARLTKQNHGLVAEGDRMANEVKKLEEHKASIVQQLLKSAEREGSLQLAVDMAVATSSKLEAALAQKQSALDTVRNNTKQDYARFETVSDGFRSLEAELRVQAEECSTKLRNELSNNETLRDECCRLKSEAEEQAIALQDGLSQNKTLAEKNRNLETQLGEQAARLRDRPSSNKTLKAEYRKLKEESDRLTKMMNFFQQELDRATKQSESHEKDNFRLRQRLEEWRNIKLSSRVMQPRAFLQGFRRLEPAVCGASASPTMPEHPLEQGDVQDVDGMALTAGAWKPPAPTILEPDDLRVGVRIFPEAEGTTATFLADDHAESDVEPGDISTPEHKVDVTASRHSTPTRSATSPLGPHSTLHQQSSAGMPVNKPVIAQSSNEVHIAAAERRPITEASVVQPPKHPRSWNLECERPLTALHMRRTDKTVGTVSSADQEGAHGP
ncbi:hypothetical protein LTR37_004255 [Vermiconidia calcicola]|uniref:Uncharacterized protein n=1 Tax=Vermiconidia calcicola TaxID=1690605 RepID=A0ACC3NNB2_9PEZI|nr:hypothetical protein LTR37_004255 [Vermiconidia calcicola]